jgi:hypothetical protein
MLQLHRTSTVSYALILIPQSRETDALGREIVNDPCGGIILVGQGENSSDA